MANVINLNITPLHPIQTDTYTLISGAIRPPLAQPPNKRLRSCLSPARSRPTTPFEDPDESRSGRTSRSTSYGSERSKSVRWEGEVPVTSYFDTWSRDEYDRTPLEAPSAEERACVLPERNSRCMTRTYQCFLSGVDDEYEFRAAVRTPSPIHESPLSSPALAALDEALTAIHELPGECLDWDDQADDFEVEHEEDVAVESEIGEEDEDEEDSEWDECMRRRMMFLQYSRLEGDRQPQFDGYRSISSTIADVLRSVGCDEPAANESGAETVISAENLKLVDPCPPATPSLTSASTSEASETDTLVNSDSIPLPSPHSLGSLEDVTIKVTLDELIPTPMSITPTPVHPQLPTR